MPDPRISRGTGFKRALFWSYVVSAGLYIVTALVTFVLAAILGPEDFGLLWMAMVWVALAQLLLQHGPTIAVIQQDHITDRHLDAAFWSNLVGACLFALLLAAVAPLWAAVNQLPELTLVCLALTAIVPLYALNTVPEAVLRRKLQLRGLALRYLISAMVSGVVAIGCALAGFGVWALVIQQVGLTLGNTVLLWLMTPWRPRLHRVSSELRDIRSTSLKTLAGAVGSFVLARADVLLLGVFFGPVVVGLFRFALRVPEMVSGLTARGLQDVALPDMARHSLDREALAARLGRLVHTGAVLSMPALGVVAGIAEPFVRLIGDQWMLAADPMRVLCLAVGLTIVAGLFGPALQAAQRPGLPALVTWLNAACMAAAIFIAAEASANADTTGKLMAVAWAVVIVSAALGLVLGYLVFGRVLRASPWHMIRSTIPSLLAGIAAAAVGYALPGMLEPGLLAAVELLLIAVVAGAVAAGVVLVLDPQARVWVRMVRDRMVQRGRF